MGKLAKLLGIEYVTWSVASAAIGPASGLSVNGADESSGSGSIEITAVAWRSQNETMACVPTSQ